MGGKCPCCGAPIKDKQCEYCGYILPTAGETVRKPFIVINNNITGNINTITRETHSSKSKAIALLLCIFLGYFGAHYFYVGRWGKGILYLFTVGLLGIGWIVDIFVIAGGKFKDADGLYLR